MPRVNAYLAIATSDEAGAKEIARETAKDVAEGRLTLLALVRELGNCLTDDDRVLRAQTVAYLASILEFLPTECLTRQQISVLCQFLCERVEDASGLKEAAQGLIALQRQTRFIRDHAASTAQALFVISPDFMRHPQGTRYVVYIVIDGLMTHYRKALQTMGDDFIVGITELVSGEKVPPNLMLVLSILRAVMVEWDISNHVEVLFDSVFCYFPITFRPPANDPYRITAQDLKKRLRDCLASNQLFADYLFPALVEKLEAPSANTRRDILQVFAACFESYDPASIAPQAINLWDALKGEVLTPQDTELGEEALIAIQGTASCLSKARADGAADSQMLGTYLAAVLKECLGLLEDPPGSQARAAVEIIARIGVTSRQAYQQVVPVAIKELVRTSEQATTLEMRLTSAGMTNRLLKCESEPARVDTQWRLEQLADIKDRLFGLYTRCLMGSPTDKVSLRRSAIEGLVILSQIRGYLDNQDLRLLISHLNDVILNEKSKGQETVQKSSIDALTRLAGTSPALVFEIALPKFLARLPDASSCRDVSYLSILKVLAHLTRAPELSFVIYRRLLSRLQTLDNSPDQVTFGQAVLAAIYHGLTHHDKFKGDRDHATLALVVIKPLADKLIFNSITWPFGLLDRCGMIIGELLSDIPSEQQSNILRKISLYPLLDIKINKSLITAESLFNQRNTDLVDEIVWEKRTVVSPWILAALHRSVDITPALPCLELIARKDRERSSSAAQILSIVANKWPQHLDRPGAFAMDASDIAADQVRHRLRISLFLLKGWILRKQPGSLELLTTLCASLSSPDHGPTLARAFDILLAPSKFATKANHAIASPLHAQRVFSVILPLLSTEIRNTETAQNSKTNQLIAFSRIAQHLPQRVILNNLDMTTPLLLLCLDLPDHETRVASIKALHMVLLEDPLSLESHTRSIVTRLLTSANPTNVSETHDQSMGNPPPVRRAALRCLASFPTSMPMQTLTTVKTQVVRDLQETVDDPRRSVRKEAVDCRTAWLRLDEPDDE